MAIKFDDRIKTNVADDVLITGEQVAISTDNSIIRIGTDEHISIGSINKIYDFLTLSTKIETVNDLPNAIDKIAYDVVDLTKNVIKPAIENLNNKFFTINTNTKFFGDTLISGTSQLNDYLKNIKLNLPLITLLSAPIKLSTQYTHNGLFYSTKFDAYYGTDLTIIPKDTLICVISTHDVDYNVFTNDKESCLMGILDSNIQILSMPVSTDSIPNNFETRIANIENLLALKQ